MGMPPTENLWADDDDDAINNHATNFTEGGSREREAAQRARAGRHAKVVAFGRGGVAVLRRRG
jgi:hypothetical protein